MFKLTGTGSCNNLNRAFSYYLPLITLLLLFNKSYSQKGWELAKDKNGIKVFTAEDPSSKFRSIKVEAVFKGNLQKLAAIIFDVANTPKWVYGTKEAYLIKKINEREIVYYSETALPWPVNNRDVVIRMKSEGDPQGKTLTVTETLERDVLPSKKGKVRLNNFYASWHVTNDGRNNLVINYILKMDPGGNIPSGIINMFVTKGPYETFENLRKLLSAR